MNVRQLLLNPQSRYNFESRILIVSLFVSAIICAAILAVVTSFNFSDAVFAVVLAATLLSAATFVMVLEGRYINLIKQISVFGFPIISSYMWFFTNGLYGHAPTLIMVNSFISLLIDRNRRYLIIIYYTTVFLLLLQFKSFIQI